MINVKLRIYLHQKKRRDESRLCVTMGEARLELARYCYQGILSPSCLPSSTTRPYLHEVQISINYHVSIKSNQTTSSQDSQTTVHHQVVEICF